MINYQTITIDLQPDYREPVVQMYLSERDVGRPIQVNVLMQGQPYSFTAGTTVHIDLRKPSGKTVQVNGNYAVGSNVVLFNVVEQMAAEPGMCLTELSIVGDGQDPIGSKNWLTKVELSPMHSGDPSETWIEDLDELVQDAMEGHIDATLSIEGDAADAKAAGDAIAAAVEQIPAVDDTLTVSGAAADAAAVGEELADLKSAFSAFPSGTYPDMTVGGLMSEESATVDQMPYTLRASGGGVAVGNREIDELVGGTVAWNQLENMESGSSSGLTFTKNSNGSITISGTSTATISRVLVQPSQLQTGHKILIWRSVEGDYPTIQTNGSNLWRSYIHTVTDDDYVRFRVPSDVTINATLFVGVFDLTQMFGPTIADYVAALETVTAGAGVAWFKRLFPNDYYVYDAGSLKSVEGVSAHIMRDADNNIIGNYPLDSTLKLQGIFKLDSANRLYANGDIYPSSGLVQRRYELVDLGALNWTYETGPTYPYFHNTTAISNLKRPANNGEKANVICGKYVTADANSPYLGNVTHCVAVQSSGHQILIYDTGYTDAATFKAAMSGVYLVYELATPTTEQAAPYTNPQIVDNLGTEEYVTTGIVPVGHYTKYPTDIVAKVDGLPSNFSTLIATTENGMTASRTYAVNNFLIVDNQLYRVTAAIASGATITPGTNVTAVTVADILTQLLNA